MESSFWRPIFKALGYLDNLENVFVLGCRIDILLKELLNHFLLGCLKRKGVAHHAVDISEVMIARVVGILLYLKGNI